MNAIHAKHLDFGASIIREVIRRTEPILVRADHLDLRMTGQTEPLSKFVNPWTGKPITLDGEDGLVRSDERLHENYSDTDLPDDQMEARMAIMALRLGQCPSKFIKQITVGADEVQLACTWALDRAKTRRPAYLVFESPFGKGKTHALNMLSCMAEASGFAVGSVVLDGIGTSMSQPMSLLGALVNGIRFPANAGVESLSERLCNYVQNRLGSVLSVTGAHFLANCLSAIPREIAEQPDAWDIVVDYLACELAASQAKAKLREYTLHGNSVNLPAIVAHARVERPERCVNMLKEWAQACTRLGAPHGLVVTLDEADVDYGNSGFSHSIVKQRTGLLDKLRNIAEDETSRTPIVVAIAITPGESSDWDEDPVDELIEHLGEDAVTHVSLRDLDPDDFVELGMNVSRIYNEAFGERVFTDAAARTQAKRLSEKMASRLADGCLPRSFVRHFIELLDLKALEKAAT